MSPCYRFIHAGVRAFRRLDPRARGPAPEAPPRILLVELNSVGDVLVSSYLVGGLRERYPDSRLEVATSPAGAAYYRSILRPDEQVYAVPARGLPWMRGVRRLRTNRYQLALAVLPVCKNTWTLLLSGARQLCGCLDYSSGNTFYALPQTLTHTATGQQATSEAYGPILARVAAILSLLGRPTSMADLARFRPLTPVGQACSTARVVISFLSKDPQKAMPAELITRLTTHLKERWSGFLQVTIITPPERSQVDPAWGLQVEEAGSIQTTVDYLHQSALFIGVDSAQIHMAQMTAVPVIGLFGPTTPGMIRYRSAGFHAFGGEDGAPRKMSDLLHPDRWQAIRSCVDQVLAAHAPTRHG